MTYSERRKNETPVDFRTTCLTLVISKDRKAGKEAAARGEL